MIERIYISFNNIKKIQMVYCMKYQWIPYVSMHNMKDLLQLDSLNFWEFPPRLLQAEWTSHSMFPYSANIQQSPKIISKFIWSTLFTFLVSISNVHSCLSSAFGRSYNMCHPIRRFESNFQVQFHGLKWNNPP